MRVSGNDTVSGHGVPNFVLFGATTRSRWAKTEQNNKTQPSVTNRATHLCKCNGVADLLKTLPSHMCYHSEFGRSALKGAGINIEEPQKLGNAGILLSWDEKRGCPK